MYDVVNLVVVVVFWKYGREIVKYGVEREVVTILFGMLGSGTVQRFMKQFFILKNWL